MKLRRQLVITMIILVAVGLAAVNIITFTSLHSYLYGRVDDQLNGASRQMAAYVARADAEGLRGDARPPSGPTSVPTCTWS